jgi:hypothetical protein
LAQDLVGLIAERFAAVAPAVAAAGPVGAAGGQ